MQKIIYLTFIFFISSRVFSSECLYELKSKYSSLETIKPEFAKNFVIYKTKKFTFLKIKKLWIGDTFGKGYFLNHKPKGLKSCQFEKKIILTKKNLRIIPLSTTYIAFLEALKRERNIVGFPNTHYINSIRTRALVSEKKIKNLKHPLLAEEVISQKPDLIISYSSSSPEILGLEKIEKLTSKVIYFPEYLENEPLGRAEWIKVMGYLTNRIPESVIFFNHVKKEYLKVKNSFLKLKNKKNILLGSKSEGKWGTPKSDSYLSLLVKDAGGINVLDQDKGREITFEKILTLKKNIDIWLPHTVWNNKSEMLSEDKKYQLLYLDSKISIYNSSKRISKDAGFDFWETGLSRPDLILKDLAAIFYQEDNQDLNLKWYQKL